MKCGPFFLVSKMYMTRTCVYDRWILFLPVEGDFLCQIEPCFIICLPTITNIVGTLMIHTSLSLNRICCILCLVSRPPSSILCNHTSINLEFRFKQIPKPSNKWRTTYTFPVPCHRELYQVRVLHRGLLLCRILSLAFPTNRVP